PRAFLLPVTTIKPVPASAEPAGLLLANDGTDMRRTQRCWQRVTVAPVQTQAMLFARLQQGSADEVGRVARPELSHRLCAMTLEGARADLHAKRALLVGIALADQIEDLALALGQRLLAGIRRWHGGRAPAAFFAALGSPLRRRILCRKGQRNSHRRAAGLLDKGADALGLQQRVLDHLLQMIALAGFTRQAVTVLFEFFHVQQKRRQRPIELTHDRTAVVVKDTRSHGAEPADLKLLAGSAGLAPTQKLRISNLVFLL